MCVGPSTTTGPTPTAINTAGVLSAVSIFFLSFGIILFTCMCMITAVCFYCILRIKR